MDITLEILYQDEHLVAINKPSGLLVHRSLIDARETQFAMQLTRNQIGQRVYPVHRLDKATSGVLLFALNREVARLLTDSFTAGDMHKRYLAIVRGHTDAEGLIDYALREKLDKIADADADKDKAAQTAITSYRCLSQTELPFAVGRYETARYSLVELNPKTGRRHQLRRHMKHIFHPILGDTSYGDGKHNRFIREQFTAYRLLLHAQLLKLQHPVTGAGLIIQAQIPEEFERIQSALDL